MTSLLCSCEGSCVGAGPGTGQLDDAAQVEGDQAEHEGGRPVGDVQGRRCASLEYLLAQHVRQRPVGRIILHKRLADPFDVLARIASGVTAGRW